MGTRSDPQSHTWTVEAVGNIITTNKKMLTCRAEGDFNMSIPEDLLCYFSRYYSALLRGGFSETGQDNVTLALDASQAKWFVTWLYTGRFPEDLDYQTLFQLYIFADKADVPAMRKDIMTHIHERSHRKGCPAIKDAIYAFDKLPKSSGLVRWIVDRFAIHIGRSTLHDHPEFLSHTFNAAKACYAYSCPKTSCIIFVDSCCSVLDNDDCGRGWVRRGQACAYHEHESPEEWKGKLHTFEPSKLKTLLTRQTACAGDDFQQSVDLSYLKGTTAINTVSEKRFANFENPDSMVWTLSSCP